MAEKLTVQHLKGKNVVLPTQGYEGDVAHDIYAAEGRLVPPLTFGSVIVPTNHRIAFDPEQAGLKITLRSGTAAKTPLIIPNAPGIVEGTYRDGLGIIVRNSFIDNSLVNFVIDIDRNKVPLSEVPNMVKKEARKLFEKEMELLGYELDSENPFHKAAFKTAVPRGTVYIPQGSRFAQIHFSKKIEAEFVEVDALPDSIRGEKGFGSSGSKKGNKNG